MPASTVRPSNVLKNLHHKGLRRADKEAINEFFRPEPTPEPVSYYPERPWFKGPNPIDGYRCVIMTQCYENYAVWDWDGKGVCPESWRAKGGMEYHVATGLHKDQCTPELARELADKFRDDIVRRNDAFREWIISVQFYGLNDETPDEAMMADEKFWGERHIWDVRKFLCPKAQIELAWAEHAKFVAAQAV